jgi:hypothetical protein
LEAWAKATDLLAILQGLADGFLRSVPQSLQEFPAAVEQLVHLALVGPLRAAACTFYDGVKDWEVKEHFLMGGKKSLNETLNLNLNLKHHES